MPPSRQNGRTILELIFKEKNCQYEELYGLSSGQVLGELLIKRLAYAIELGSLNIMSSEGEIKIV